MGNEREQEKGGGKREEEEECHHQKLSITAHKSLFIGFNLVIIEVGKCYKINP